MPREYYLSTDIFNIRIPFTQLRLCLGRITFETDSVEEMKAELALKNIVQEP